MKVLMDIGIEEAMEIFIKIQAKRLILKNKIFSGDTNKREKEYEKLIEYGKNVLNRFKKSNDKLGRILDVTKKKNLKNKYKHRIEEMTTLVVNNIEEFTPNLKEILIGIHSIYYKLVNILLDDH